MEGRLQILEVFPACAGVIPLIQRFFSLIGSIPRVCGGDPLEDIVALAKAGVFPACAGVIPTLDLPSRKEAGIPRVCGGDPSVRNLLSVDLTYSPRVRG